MRRLACAFLAALLSGTAWADTTLVFELDLRAEIAAGRFDPARDRVGLRGGTAPLSWDRPLLATPGDTAGRYTLRLTLPDDAAGGQPLAYKFRIERGAGQDGSDGWEPRSLRGGEVRVSRAFGPPASDAPVVRTGRIERLGLVPSAHVRPREVQVWLPPGYEQDPQARYPVLYLHDGQNVFDAEAAGAEWQVDEAAQQGVLAGRLRPFIVVAVASTGTRTLDYTPSPMGPPGERQGGGVAAYGRFLVEELKPLIDTRFRTRPGPEHTTIGGSSFGGIAALWLALHRPGTFGSALVVSPSVWWDNGWVLRDVASLSPTPRPRLWVDRGAQEGEQAVQLARALDQALWQRGWPAAQLRFVEDPRGSHDEASWARRVPAMLDFLYGTSGQAQ